MARSNADFNKWLVAQIKSECDGEVGRIVELGSGPGVGLQETLEAFPSARVWGVDPSPEMLAQSRRRNIDHVRSGRLTLISGGPESLEALAPIDLVLASHVLYFWHQPALELTRIRDALRPGGWLALGYQLRPNMPPVSQKNFPREGHVLYESDDDLSVLLSAAGFKNLKLAVKGPSNAPEGRLAIGRRGE